MSKSSETKPIEFTFNERKATQMAARLIELEGGKIDFAKMLKLMYLIDRQALGDWGSPITGDVSYSMDHGPVLSKVYNLIKDPPANSYWKRHIRKPRRHDISLKKDTPGVEDLSEADTELIDQFSKIFRLYTFNSIVDHCHNPEVCPEWTDPHGTSKRIGFEDILQKKFQKSAEQIETISQEAHAIRLMEKILGEGKFASA